MRELIIKYKSMINYVLFGAVTTAVNLAAYFVCYHILFIDNVPSTVIAWVFAVAVAFLTNKTFVFDSRSWEAGVVFGEAMKFVGCRFGTGVIEVVIMYVSVDLMHMSGVLMKLLTNVIVVVLNYIFSKLFIFVHAEQ